MIFTLSCNEQTIQAEVITSSFSKTEIFYNKLKQADNSARFQCVFTSDLADFLKLNINNDIEVQITEGNTDVFFGYVRKTVSFTKTQVNEPISIEVVSPSYLLEKPVPYAKAYLNKTLEEILVDILTAAGVEAVGDCSALSYSPQIITIEKDSDYKSVITEMLYEYGYVWDFDNSGYFQIYPLFDIPEHSAITNTFNGVNSLDEINITASERVYDSVRASYNNVKEYQDALIFRDTSNSGSEGAGTCLQPVDPTKFFLNEKYNYLDADSDKGEVVYIDTIRPDVVADSTSISWDARAVEMDPGKDNYGKPLGKQICFTAYNSSANVHNFTRIDFYGHAFIATSEVEIRSYGERKAQDIKLSFISEKVKAEEFAAKVSAWQRFANNEITVKSISNYPIGSFVKVTDRGIGTYYGRIIKKLYKLNTSKIEYLIETVEDYIPASITDESRPSNGGMYGALNSALNQANQHTDDAISSAQMQASPIYSAVFNTTVIKKGTDGGYSPANVSARGRALTGDDQEEIYAGVFEVYINNQIQPAVTVSGSALNMTVEELMAAGGVDDLTAINIEFYANNGVTMIDSQHIPVLTGAAAYAVILDNPFQTYEADENGAIGERTITTKARVFYGLQEMEYLAENGWEYGAIVPPEGFTVSVNTQSGVITITALEGSVMPDNGRIEIPVFIHSQTNIEYFIGYIGNQRSATEYYMGYDNKFLGYLTPDENGYYYTYFNFQKLTETAIKLAALNTKVDHYWEILSDDLKITIAEKETLRLLLNSVRAEYDGYTARYSNHTKYNAYKNAYDQLNEAVSTILAFAGIYTFYDQAAKDAFNQKFTNYYNTKSALDAEIASVSTNFGGLSTVNQINEKNPKPTDYFVWIGPDQTEIGTLSLRTGLVYCWNGTAWVQDNDNSHIMNTLKDVMNYIKESDDETIPAVSFAKQFTALKVVTDELSANFATINFLQSGNIEATNLHLIGNSSIDGEVNAKRGTFYNVEIKDSCKVFGSIGDYEYLDSEEIIASKKCDFMTRTGSSLVIISRGYEIDFVIAGRPSKIIEYRPVGLYLITSVDIPVRLDPAIGSVHNRQITYNTIWTKSGNPSFTKKTKTIEEGFMDRVNAEYYELSFSGSDFKGCKISHLIMN